MTRFTAVVVGVGICTSTLLAQSNNWQLTFVTGDTLSHVTLLTLNGDTLIVLHEGTNHLIAVASLREVRLVKESAVWETAERYATVVGITGGLVSGILIAVSAKGGGFYSVTVSNTTAKILGALIGAVAYGAVFAILGGFVGSVVGIIQGADDVFDLSQLSLKGKVVTMQKILSHQ